MGLMRLPVLTKVAMQVLVISILSTASSAPSLAVSAQTIGTVKGTVMDPQGAAIPGATVIFENRHARQTVVTNDAGAYEIQLPTDTYSISTDLPAYYPFRRATFSVRPGSVTIINIAPLLRVLSVGLEVTSSGIREPVTKAPAPQYDSFWPSNSSETGLDLLVRFSRRRKREDKIEYRGAVASYDALTIYADKIRLDPKKPHFMAEGNVVVEDGNQRHDTNRAEIEFKAGQPVLKLGP
jgi:hypothetical protein